MDAIVTSKNIKRWTFEIIASPMRAKQLMSNIIRRGRLQPYRSTSQPAYIPAKALPRVMRVIEEIAVSSDPPKEMINGTACPIAIKPAKTPKK